MSTETAAHAPAGLYAIHYLDNWDGQGDRYYLIARKDEQGRWFAEENGTLLMQYQGDKVLQVWPLAAHDHHPSYMTGAPLLSTAAQDVLAERNRQLTAEGWTPAHDDLYCAAELPRAAAAYILNGANDEAPAIWPFTSKWWKPRDARANYVRAGALILAEVERLDRATAQQAEQEQQP
ncbi:hypothetical protein SAMN05878276_0376 [Aquipseudomonas alcaligenes]|uniref:hypothetical protein n=1 Tax=Aquipseudomonas alcaligenes TaxID=43263 RepID=UPI0009559014|nr:hypothetical protein [Pseudomonas alcaligenes]SIR82043.1 hypothetical protein SAMN05878276_0376 [Pseudomonas alcaligenes]